MSRLVAVIWMFVVLILTSSYTASLTSMLTVQQLQPKTNNIGILLQSKSRVGYQDGSFVYGMLRQIGFSNKSLQNYSTPEQYKDALLNGSVDAMVDEIPYLKIFLSEYCADFAMIDGIYKTGGFGFVFPRGSPHVAHVSRAILNVTESDMMMNIKRKWFGSDQRTCSAGSNDIVSSLDVRRFGGLFVITGTVSILSLVLYIGIFIWKEWDDLMRGAAIISDQDRSGGSIWDKMAAWARHYDTFKGSTDSSSVITDQTRKRSDKELISCKNVANTDQGLQLNGTSSLSDHVSTANFALPERVVVSVS